MKKHFEYLFAGLVIRVIAFCLLMAANLLEVPIVLLMVSFSVIVVETYLVGRGVLSMKAEDK